MAFPEELAFDSENKFTEGFVVPLLQRLGFQIIAHYHRTHGELGKDLVFADVDRFGHVRYAGLQAKCEATIGLKSVETLVQDCKQAFANPFNHPNTHTEHRIETFYGVNAGSISPDATTHFFNSVGAQLGACSRLLDGKALLVLDRWAAANRAASILPDLNGLSREIEFNRKLSERLVPWMKKQIASLQGVESGKTMTNAIFPNRFRLNATGQYLRRPFVVEELRAELVDAYWEQLAIINGLFDQCMGVSTVGTQVKNLGLAIEHLTAVIRVGQEIKTSIDSVLHTLGTLRAV